MRWILWFTLGYAAAAATAAAAAAAVCRDFTVTPLEAAIFQLSLLNLVGMFMVTRACLGLLLAATAVFMSTNAIFRQLASSNFL